MYLLFKKSLQIYREFRVRWQEKLACLGNGDISNLVLSTDQEIGYVVLATKLTFHYCCYK